MSFDRHFLIIEFAKYADIPKYTTKTNIPITIPVIFEILALLVALSIYQWFFRSLRQAIDTDHRIVN